MKRVRVTGRVLTVVGLVWLIITFFHSFAMTMSGHGDSPIPPWYWPSIGVTVSGAVLWAVGSADWRYVRDWFTS